MPKNLVVVVAFAFVCLALPARAPAGDWPHWRGPSFDGTSDETGLAATWHAGDDGETNVRWSRALPGPAGATPVVWGDTVYLTSTDRDGDGLSVLAIGTDGTLRWQTRVDDGSIEVFPQLAHETNAAAPSPVTDGEHVWALFTTAKLYRLGLDGAVDWSVDLAERYGMPNLYFGYSTSPLVHGDLVYLQLLHADAQLVLALDKTTGAEAWRWERPTDAQQESRQSYASVLPFETGAGPAQVLVHGADYLSGHDTASGRELWRFGTMNPADGYNPMFRFVATPAVHGELVVIPTAKRGPVFALRPGGATGALGTDTDRLAWTLQNGTPDVPSPVVHDGLVYLGGENGRLTVLDLKTGDTVYEERTHQSPHRASPVVADGKVYLTATDGTVTVIKAGRSFEVLAENTVGGGRLAASPAVSGGVIYLRTAETLYAIADEPKATTTGGEAGD